MHDTAERKEHQAAIRSLLEARQMTENAHLVGLAALVEAAELIERLMGPKVRAKWVRHLCCTSDAEAEAMSPRWIEAAEELKAGSMSPSTPTTSMMSDRPGDGGSEVCECG